MNMHSLYVSLSRNGYYVSVMGDRYPGTKQHIRIDGGKVYSSESGFSGSVAREIVEQLKTAKSVTTRYTSWPWNIPRDEKIQLYGFNEALSYLHWGLQHLR